MIKHTKEILEKAVAESNTWAEVCRKVGVKPFTGSQTHLKKRCIEFGLDHSHFTGQAWSKGKPSPKKKHVSEYLVKDSKAKSHKIRLLLISEGLKKAECEICHLTEWNGTEIPLELDHINSDHWDNRIENLQIICPNCHAQETSKRKIKI